VCFLLCFFGEKHSPMLVGGEFQRVVVFHVWGYSELAQCTGKPARQRPYLTPIRGSMHVPIGAGHDNPTTPFTL
jgi:hypothetical protein